jgi:CHAT domain-containing protein
MAGKTSVNHPCADLEDGILTGVETLIMSLWEVADEATSKLMGEFYRRWLGGESRQEAFKGAQGAVRELYPDPYYWAAFVIMD